MRTQIASIFATVLMAITGCTDAQTYMVTLPQLRDDTPIHIGKNEPALTAMNYYGYNEYTHRTELKTYLGVDPVQTQWCAAFVNSVLEESGIPSNKDHDYPLTARAYLDWGMRIEPTDIQAGDIVVFPRGNVSWQGHVGFYLRTIERNGKDYYLILGGNQNNKVSVEFYPANKAIGIRRNTPI